jgi:Tfp pilus assembly protein PilO
MPRQLPEFVTKPEIVVILCMIFSAGVAWGISSSQAASQADTIKQQGADIKTLQSHDYSNVQTLATIKQRLDDIADHFGIPKRDMRFNTHIDGDSR